MIIPLALPSPAEALRPLSAGMEESPVHRELRESLGLSTAGLEEPRKRKESPSDALARTLKSLGLPEWSRTYLHHVALSRPYKDALATTLKTLGQGLGRARIDPLFIAVVLIIVARRDGLERKAQDILDAAGPLATLTKALQQPPVGAGDFGIPSAAIIMEVALTHERIGEQAAVLTARAADLAGLLSTLEVVGITDDSTIRHIVGKLASRDDVAVAIEATIELAQALHRGGIDAPEIEGVLRRIVFEHALPSIARRLSDLVTNLPGAQATRVAFEEDVLSLRRAGQLQRSIVTLAGASGFIAAHLAGYYVIVTNTHVVWFEGDSITVETSTFLPEPREHLGTASVVLRAYSGLPETGGDLAILLLSDQEVRGNPLIPMRMTDQIDEGQVAVVVSGSQDTISSGHLVSLGDDVIMLGAETRGGDSGSPYLVKTPDGYRVAAIHRAAGPLGDRLTLELLQQLMATLEGQATRQTKFLRMTDDQRQVAVVKQFLEGLMAAASRAEQEDPSAGLEELDQRAGEVFVVIGPTALEQVAGLEEALAALQPTSLAERFILLPAAASPEELATRLIPILYAGQPSVMTVGTPDDPVIARARSMLRSWPGIVIQPHASEVLHPLVQQFNRDLKGAAVTELERAAQDFLMAVGLEQAA